MDSGIERKTQEQEYAVLTAYVMKKAKKHLHSMGIPPMKRTSFEALC